MIETIKKGFESLKTIKKIRLNTEHIWLELRHYRMIIAMCLRKRHIICGRYPAVATDMICSDYSPICLNYSKRVLLTVKAFLKSLVKT